MVLKPRIKRQGGIWRCSAAWSEAPFDISGIGVTPAGAYRAWQKTLERRHKEAQKRARRESSFWRYIR